MTDPRTERMLSILDALSTVCAVAKRLRRAQKTGAPQSVIRGWEMRLDDVIRSVDRIAAQGKGEIGK